MQNNFQFTAIEKIYSKIDYHGYSMIKLHIIAIHIMGTLWIDAATKGCQKDKIQSETKAKFGGAIALSKYIKFLKKF